MKFWQPTLRFYAFMCLCVYVCMFLCVFWQQASIDYLLCVGKDGVVVLLHFRFLCYTHMGLLLFLRALLLGSGFVTFSVFR